MAGLRHLPLFNLIKPSEQQCIALGVVSVSIYSMHDTFYTERLNLEILSRLCRKS